MIAIYCRISREKEAGKDRSINDQRLSGIELAKKTKYSLSCIY
jgi:site-specific DNA recombinase